MLRCSRLRSAIPSEANVEQYLMHLFPTPGQEANLMSNIMPSAENSLNEVAAFHRILVRKMRNLGHKPIGMKVIPPNANGPRALHQPMSVCTPIFSCHRIDSESVLDLKESRVQNVEVSMGFFLKEAPEVARLLSLGQCRSLAPVIELTSSRFPLFPTNAIGYAADLCSTAYVCVGAEKPIPREINHHGCVLLKDNEPLRIGYPKNCLGSPDSALEVAGAYADSIGMMLAPDTLIVLSGLHARVPVKKGMYESQLGPLGSVSCLIK
eukprot:Tbor_TRINITY_DN2168_c0_g1::TRINITY_DN2168_c0_g1_i1::g.5433::m.5433